MHSSVGVFQGSVSNQLAGANRRVLWRMRYLRQSGGGGVGAMCLSFFLNLRRLPGGVLKEYFGWGSAAGTLEPLAYTRPSSTEFCYPILD